MPAQADPCGHQRLRWSPLGLHRSRPRHLPGVCRVVSEELAGVVLPLLRGAPLLRGESRYLRATYSHAAVGCD
ncbi:MAG: hypothetical protein JW384_03104 [Nitrosomonadaceae bacterium]|nr:hypothetical protein [Nitrosomonadaceae bacterium]